MKKQGMAIPIVLLFATIMGLVSTFLIRSARQYNKQNQTSFAQLQSYFIARAGVEHTLLKVKYLHRELYDAICLSQGRNPLFDFSLITDITSPESAIKQYNPGPIFLYSSGQFENTGIFTPSFVINNSQGNNVQKKWLEIFESDITSVPSDTNKDEGKKINSVLDLTNLPSDMKDPFKNAQYSLSDLAIAASEVKENSGKVDNSVVVEFKITSVLKTSREEDFNFEIKKSVKVSRD